MQAVCHYSSAVNAGKNPHQHRFGQPAASIYSAVFRERHTKVTDSQCRGDTQDHGHCSRLGRLRVCGGFYQALPASPAVPATLHLPDSRARSSPSGRWWCRSHLRTQTLAGVPSVNGLYAAVAALAAYALFGTCRDLNMGAESTGCAHGGCSGCTPGHEPRPTSSSLTLIGRPVGRRLVCVGVRWPTWIHQRVPVPPDPLPGTYLGQAIIIVISQLESLFMGLDIDANLYTTDIGAVVRNLDDSDGPHDINRVSRPSCWSSVFVPWRQRSPHRLLLSCSEFWLSPCSIWTQRVWPPSATSTPACQCPGSPTFHSISSPKLLLPALGIALLAYPRQLSHRQLLGLVWRLHARRRTRSFLALGAVECSVRLSAGHPG